MSNRFRFLVFLAIAASLFTFILHYDADITNNFKKTVAFLPIGAVHPKSASDGDATFRYKYCYKKNSSSIIFLQLTNTSDEWAPLEICVFKRAAILNPDAGVCVLTKSEMKPQPILTSLPNLEFAPLDIEFIFNGTPILSWYEDYVLNETLASRNVITELSDALRLAYLFKYGGIYLDTDTLVLRNLGKLRNAAGMDGGGSIANGELFFDQGHPFIKTALNQFLKAFRPGVWGSIGPSLITSVHQSGSVNRSTYRILEPSVLYPVSWQSYRLAFSAKDKENVKLMMKNSFTLHLYRHMTFWSADIKEFWGKKELPVGCIVEELCQ